MHEIEQGKNLKHYVGEEFADLYEKNPDNPESKHYLLRQSFVLRCFTNRKLFRELITIWKQKSGLRSNVIYETHADFSNKKWYLVDKGGYLPVQDLINSLDGKYAAIMLLMCNPNNTTIESKISLVFHPNKSLNLPMALATGHMRLFAPGNGYIEKDYKKMRKLIDSFK